MIGEALFGAALMASWTNSAVHVAAGDRPIYAESTRGVRPSVGWGRLGILAALTLGFFCLVYAFVTAGALRWAPGVGALVALGVVRRFEIAAWPGDIVVRLGKYAPSAACLLGWLVAYGVARGRGASLSHAEKWGFEAAAGVLASVYVLAGIAKLRESGWGWVRARQHALLIAERAYTGPGWVRGVRLWVARSRGLCALVGLAGLFIELGAVAYLWPDARPMVAVLVIGLHGGFKLLLGYSEPELIFLWVALTAVTT